MAAPPLTDDLARMVELKEQLAALPHDAEYKEKERMRLEFDVVAQRAANTMNLENIPGNEAARAANEASVKHYENVAAEFRNCREHRANMERIWAEGFRAIADALAGRK